MTKQILLSALCFVQATSVFAAPPTACRKVLDAVLQENQFGTSAKLGECVGKTSSIGESIDAQSYSQGGTSVAFSTTKGSKPSHSIKVLVKSPLSEVQKTQQFSEITLDANCNITGMNYGMEMDVVTPSTCKSMAPLISEFDGTETEVLKAKRAKKNVDAAVHNRNLAVDNLKKKFQATEITLALCRRVNRYVEAQTKAETNPKSPGVDLNAPAMNMGEAR